MMRGALLLAVGSPFFGALAQAQSGYQAITVADGGIIRGVVPINKEIDVCDPNSQKKRDLQARKIVNDVSVPQFSRNTLRLIVCVLRGLLIAALEDGLITANPASRGEVH